MLLLVPFANTQNWFAWPNCTVYLELNCSSGCDAKWAQNWPNVVSFLRHVMLSCALCAFGGSAASCCCCCNNLNTRLLFRMSFILFARVPFSSSASACLPLICERVGCIYVSVFVIHNSGNELLRQQYRSNKQQFSPSEPKLLALE